MKKEITEKISKFTRKEPTALQFIDAILCDKDLSPKLAMQIRLFAKTDMDNHEFRTVNYRDVSSEQYEILRKDYVYKNSLDFPIVSVKKDGTTVKLICQDPSMHEQSLTLIELKNQFRKLQVKQSDAIKLVFTCLNGSFDMGKIISVNVQTGKNYKGYHSITVQYDESPEFKRYCSQDFIRRRLLPNWDNI